MSNPNDTELFLEWQQIVPANSLLTFTNDTGVANYFGVTSIEAKLAGEFFSGPNASDATMLFTRIGLGQRPHLLGANLAGLTLAQLQAIAGPIGITFNGVAYNGNVNLASATSFADAARMIQTALRQSDPVTARTQGSTITPWTINFTGYAPSAQLLETAGPTLIVGGHVWGAGLYIASPDGNQIIYAHTKPLDGASHYSTFSSIGSEPTPEPMRETGSILYPGTVTSGTIAAGDVITGPGIPPLTAVVGPDGKNDGGWILNNAITASGDFTLRATPLEVTFNAITGKTENHDWFSVQPNGAFGYDLNPSTLGFATGLVADELGLSQISGALDSSPGGQHPTMAQFLNQTVSEADAAAEPFTALADVQQDRFDPALRLWASKHPGETFISQHYSAPPAGSWGTGGNISDGLALLHQTAAIETYSRGDVLENSGWGVTASVGHGPGPGG